MNPFKVGDKVKLLKRSYEFNPIFWRKYEGFKYSFVRGWLGIQFPLLKIVVHSTTHILNFTKRKKI